MIKPFEFYFDFASPYTLLAHKQIRRIEKENSIKMEYMPILLGGLLKSAGIKPDVDIPIKANYMIKDCKLWSEKYNIILQLCSSFVFIIYVTTYSHLQHFNLPSYSQQLLLLYMQNLLKYYNNIYFNYFNSSL